MKNEAVIEATENTIICNKHIAENILYPIKDKIPPKIVITKSENSNLESPASLQMANPNTHASEKRKLVNSPSPALQNPWKNS